MAEARSAVAPDKETLSRPLDPVPRVVFLTDIVAPYAVAVLAALAEHVELTVLFCASTGSRGMPWDLNGALPFRHRIIGGLTKRRFDQTDVYLSPRVLAALRAARPDAVISSGFSFPTFYASLYCAARRIPLLIQSDGTSRSEATFTGPRRAARAYTVRVSAGAVANSMPSADRFAELGYPSHRIFSAPHSTDVEPFARVARQRSYGTSGTLRLLVTGRLIRRKGLDRLLRAFGTAAAARPGVSLDIVGSGPHEDVLRGLVRDLGIADRVRFRGFMSQEQLPRAYAEADAYAFPTLDDPFGIVLLEAAVSGLPIIASPRGGATPDLLDDGVSGLVRDPDDTAAWTQALVALADDPALRERLGRAAHMATIHRTPDAAAAGYARAVAAVLDGATAGAHPS